MAMSREESFDMLDRWLRNNMDDEEYSEYFGALWDVFNHPKQGEVVGNDEIWMLISVLNAMASNYSNGHSWDALDSDACRRAACALTEFARSARPQQASLPIDHPSVAIGSWLSAALDDPKACDEFRRDIRAWFDAGQPTVQQTSVPDGWPERMKENPDTDGDDNPSVDGIYGDGYADGWNAALEAAEESIAAAPKPEGQS